MIKDIPILSVDFQNNGTSAVVTYADRSEVIYTDELDMLDIQKCISKQCDILKNNGTISWLERN